MQSKLEYARTASLIAAGGLCGLAWGWPGHAGFLVLSALVPLLWNGARGRWSAGAILLAYHLAASRGLPGGTGIFFARTAPAWFGWALWLAASAITAAPWTLFWSGRRRTRALVLPLILALTILPPIGWIGWANPVTAAGALFPGLGYTGLVALIVVWMAWILDQRLVILGLSVSVLAANIARPALAIPIEGWSGADTHYGALASGSADYGQAFVRIEDIEDLAATLPANHVVVMPETVLGLFTSATEQILTTTNANLARKHSAIIVGGELFGARGTQHLENALIVLGADTPPLIQRVPVPIGMWRPWVPMTFDAHPFDAGVGTVAGKHVAYAICYEQLLVYPILASFAHEPDMLIGAANDWWANTTSIPVIQGQVLDMWGRLFGVPVVRATNL